MPAYKTTQRINHNGRLYDSDQAIVFAKAEEAACRALVAAGAVVVVRVTL